MSGKAEKRKLEGASSSSSSAQHQSRREAFQRVASERAAHFARAAPSSTPTGLESVRFSEIGEDQDEWCGPFSTANKLLRQREMVKKAREEAITEALTGHVSESDSDDGKELDMYDLHVRSLVRTLKDDKPLLQRPRSTIKSLGTICLESLAVHFEHVDDIGDLSLENRATLAELLSQRRKLSDDAVQKLALSGSGCLILPECSSISRVALQDAIIKVALAKDKVVGLTTLKLNNCGFAFTDALVEEMLPYASTLEELGIVGCYRLGSVATSNLLSAASKNLKFLDLAYNSRLDASVLSIMENFEKLASVRLDFCQQLTGGHLAYLGKLKSLQYVSFAGVDNVQDEHLQKLLVEVGYRLNGLNCSGCNMLTDTSLRCIREHCSEMRELNISSCLGFSSLGILSLFVPSETSNNAPNRPLALTSAILRKLPQLTDEVIVHLTNAAGNNLLDSLDVSSCDKLTDRAIVALRIHCCHSLRDLDISFVRNVTESAMLDLLYHSSTISSVHIWGCSQLKASSFSFFSGRINSY